VQSNSALSPGETSFPHASTMRSSFASDWRGKQPSLAPGYPWSQENRRN
jgi:hypothetical protein